MRQRAGRNTRMPRFCARRPQNRLQNHFHKIFLPIFYPLMRILLVKTSSLGDVVHNLPVASDLRRRFPGARIDWCVEETFAEIPRLHPAIREVIPVAIRRWRKSLCRPARWPAIGREIRAARARLQAHDYDAILDTQGLLKSALIARQARGETLGYAREVAREPLAAHFYDRTFFVPTSLHAVERNRRLAALAVGAPNEAPPAHPSALSAPLPPTLPPALPLDYGIRPPAVDFPWLGKAPGGVHVVPYAVLLTATSRSDKLWDEGHWREVGRALSARGLTPVFPSGNAAERQRAERIAAGIPAACVAPPLGLCELAALLGASRLCIGVDTGLAHLATALGAPTVALYTATDPALTGILGAGFARNLGGKGAPPGVADVLDTAEAALISDRRAEPASGSGAPIRRIA